MSSAYKWVDCEQSLLVELVENHRLLDVYLKEMEFMLDYAWKYSEDASQAQCQYLFREYSPLSCCLP
jgi:hypothetical protein